MNVLFVAEYFPPKIMGGGEINLFLLAKILVEKGVSVSVLTSHFKGLKKYEVMEGIKVYRRLKTGVNVDNMFDNFVRSIVFPDSVVKEVKRLSKEVDIDVVHFIGSAIIGSSICKKINKKCFATIESYLTLCPKGDLRYKGENICNYKCSYFRFVECFTHSSEFGKVKNRFYLRYNPKFWIYLYLYYKRLEKSLKNCSLIAISNFVKERLREEGLSSIVIPNIIEIDKFYSNETGGKVKILYLGSLTKYKGAKILLEAVKGLNCKVDLYGDGNLKEELLEVIKENNLDATIHDNVSYDKIPKVYSEADIVVFPSLWPEPFGRIAVEAMASSKPIVATNVGAIPSIVKDAGILVKAGDVQELRGALKKLIDDKKLRDSLGQKGKELVEEYSKDNVVSKLIKLYNR